MDPLLELFLSGVVLGRNGVLVSDYPGVMMRQSTSHSSPGPVPGRTVEGKQTAPGSVSDGAVPVLVIPGQLSLKLIEVWAQTIRHGLTLTVAEVHRHSDLGFI